MRSIPPTRGVLVQDVAVYDRAPLAYDASVLKARMREPEVRVAVDLRRARARHRPGAAILSRTTT